MQRIHLRADRVESGLDRALATAPEDIVVASNRQPYRHEYGDDGEITVDRPAGGLTAGLDAVMRMTEGTWIAWGDGDADTTVVDADDRVAVPPNRTGGDGEANPNGERSREPVASSGASGTYTLRRLWLDDDEVEGYYYGVSNQVLWPLCHAALGTIESCGDAWVDYRRVNDQFASALSEAADDETLVWLQDYHLALAPRQVRERTGESDVDGEDGGRSAADATLAHTWHIPWPSWDTFRACPHRDAVLDGLLGNDLLLFHVPRYCENFLRSAERGLDETTVDYDRGTVDYRGRTTTVRAVPMGVPVDRIRRRAGSREATGFRAAFRKHRGIDRDTRLAVGVDRLDYSKGIPERLRALERLWERSPEWRGSLTYVQNGSESRSEIPAYSRLQDEVEGAVDRINDRFGTADWQPVVRVDEYLNERELYGLYRHADLALVSSVRDGMNLVAAEYAAAQIEGDGVLVLSTQTGAHDLFGEPAVSVSPFAPEQFATQIESALRMPKVERQSRMQRIRRTVAANDLWSWLRGVAETAQAVEQTRPAPDRHDSTAVGHDAY